MHIAELVRIIARRQPNVAAIEFEGGSRSFGEVYEAGLKLAGGLLSSGLAPGDRIGILAGNRPEYLEAYLACQLAGLVAVPINFRFVASEVAYVLGNCEARGLIVAEDYLPLAQVAMPQLPMLQAGVVVVLGGGRNHELSYSRLTGSEAACGTLPEVAPLAAAVIYYTSGTTGFPKGAMLSQLNMLGRLAFCGWEFGINAEDVVLIPGPIFHMSFSLIALITLAAGGRVVLMKEFDPGLALDLIERQGVTWSFMVPKMLSLLLEAAGGRGAAPKLASMRGLLSSGSLLPKALLDGVAAAMPGVRISDGYGWTETSWLSVSRHQELMTGRRSVGRAAFGSELAILDTEGNELPAEQVGEIYAANPIPFLGYYGNPAATAAMRRGKWETGGDLGYLDGDGFLYLIDRKNDMIVSGGENIYPAEIERVLADHPKVFELAVVGIPDERWGEAPCACIVLQPGAQASAEEILRFCDGRIARYKLPRSVVFLDAIPRNAMGKVLRRKLRDPYWEGHEARVR